MSKGEAKGRIIPLFTGEHRNGGSGPTTTIPLSSKGGGTLLLASAPPLSLSLSGGPSLRDK